MSKRPLPHRRPYQPSTVPPPRRRTPMKSPDEWEADYGGDIYDDLGMEPSLWDPDIGDR